VNAEFQARLRTELNLPTDFGIPAGAATNTPPAVTNRPAPKAKEEAKKN
jgi:hypothetical protein